MAKWLITPLGVIALCASGLYGNTPFSSLLGAWSVEPPGEPTVFVVLRAENSASQFETGSNNPQIIPGRWAWDDGRMVITWNDGSRHILEERDTGFEMEAFEAGSDSPSYVTSTERISSDHIGSWALTPEQRRQRRNGDDDQERGFQGNWEVTLAEEESAFFVVFPDRNAVTNWMPEQSAFRNLRGTWARQGNELHITWENGWYTILRESSRAHELVAFAPSISLDEADPAAMVARRVRDELVPGGLPAFGARGDGALGRVPLSFDDRRQAQRFFRGSWLVRRPDIGFERIQVRRFGGLTTTRQSDLRGDWRFSGQDLFLNWENGVRQVVTPVGRGFVLFEYAPGRPLDGVPNKIFRAAPAESHQRGALSQSQRDFAASLLAEAEEVARVPFIERPRSGFRTMVSTLWPFGGESVSEFPEDTLIVGDTRRGTDPWWWAFWSETSPEAEDPDEGTTPELSAEAESAGTREPIARERTWTPVF